ncbi:MAG: hypothetical protein ABIU05_12485, partial [Nitrospirales bacterium]
SKGMARTINYEGYTIQSTPQPEILGMMWRHCICVSIEDDQGVCWTRCATNWTISAAVPHLLTAPPWTRIRLAAIHQQRECISALQIGWRRAT